MTTNQLAKLRVKFIDDKRKILSSNVSALEKKLFTAIFDKLISKLETADGKIVSNGKNIDLTSAIDKIVKEFQSNEYLKTIRLFANDLTGLQALNETYFKTLEEDQKKINNISTDVDAIMRKRIGLNKEGGIVKGGFLSKLSTGLKVEKVLKQETYKAVTTGKSMSEFKDKIQGLIEGNKSTNGVLQKHFNTFVYDSYQQFDRITANAWAGKLGLEAFLYSGTKVATTRCFCKSKKGKVFTITESERWGDDLNGDCQPIWDESIDGKYKPLVQMGGYGCLDVPNYISNKMAIRIRPELVTSLS